MKKKIVKLHCEFQVHWVLALRGPMRVSYLPSVCLNAVEDSLSFFHSPVLSPGAILACRNHGNALDPDSYPQRRGGWVRDTSEQRST